MNEEKKEALVITAQKMIQDISSSKYDIELLTYICEACFGELIKKGCPIQKDLNYLEEKVDSWANNLS